MLPAVGDDPAAGTARPASGGPGPRARARPTDRGRPIEDWRDRYGPAGVDPGRGGRDAGAVDPQHPALALPRERGPGGGADRSLAGAGHPGPQRPAAGPQLRGRRGVRRRRPDRGRVRHGRRRTARRRRPRPAGHRHRHRPVRARRGGRGPRAGDRRTAHRAGAVPAAGGAGRARRPAAGHRRGLPRVAAADQLLRRGGGDGVPALPRGGDRAGRAGVPGRARAVDAHRPCGSGRHPGRGGAGRGPGDPADDLGWSGTSSSARVRPTGRTGTTWTPTRHRPRWSVRPSCSSAPTATTGRPG